ncbi:MAG TPA: hypothetical protein VF680_01470 [Allosphingosinicella sp.]|jgi:hypothetical protein
MAFKFGLQALGLLRRFWYLVPIVLLGIALKVVVAERDGLQAFQTLAVSATRDAAGEPRLAVKQVPAQIAELGRAVAKLKAGLEICTRTAKAAAANDRLRADAAAAQLAALKQGDAARADLIGRLRASAGRPRPPAPPGCPRTETSPTLKGIWR